MKKNLMFLIACLTFFAVSVVVFCVYGGRELYKSVLESIVRAPDEDVVMVKKIMNQDDWEFLQQVEKNWQLVIYSEPETTMEVSVLPSRMDVEMYVDFMCGHIKLRKIEEQVILDTLRRVAILPSQNTRVFFYCPEKRIAFYRNSPDKIMVYKDIGNNEMSFSMYIEDMNKNEKSPKEWELVPRKDIVFDDPL